MKTIALLLLLLFGCSAIQITNQAKLEDDQLDKFKQSKLALFILSFASMSARLERPLVDLDYAVSDMYEDLKEAMLEVEQDFFQRQAQNKKIIDELDQSMGNAQIEINNSNNLVDNNLKQSLASLNKKMSQLQDFVAQNKVAQSREELLQKDNQKLFEDKIQDHQIALKIIDGAFEIVQKFISGELDINARERVEGEVKELTGCLNKKYDNYLLVSALIESIPSYENMKQLKKIRQKLARIKQSIQDQYNEDIFHDRQSTSLYQKRRQQLEKEQAMFQSQIADNLHSITLIQQKISAEEEFQDLRKLDVQMYSQLKQDENAAFAYEISIYQDLRNMYQTEFELGERAIIFIKSNQFSDMVRDNLDLNLRDAKFK